MHQGRKKMDPPGADQTVAPPSPEDDHTGSTSSDSSRPYGLKKIVATIVLVHYVSLLMVQSIASRNATASTASSSTAAVFLHEMSPSNVFAFLDNILHKEGNASIDKDYPTSTASPLRRRMEMDVDDECLCVDCDEDHRCGGLWFGDYQKTSDKSELYPFTKVHVVVSHCKASLSWMDNFYLTLPQNMDVETTIVSKCGQEVVGAPSRGATNIVHLPDNVGRCDHTYAYWINNMLQGREEEDTTTSSSSDHQEVVVFVKDTVSEDNFHQVREMFLLKITVLIFLCFECFVFHVQSYPPFSFSEWTLAVVPP